MISLVEIGPDKSPVVLLRVLFKVSLKNPVNLVKVVGVLLATPLLPTPTLVIPIPLSVRLVSTVLPTV